MSAFRGALTRIITNYAESSGITKKEKVNVGGEDAREQRAVNCVVNHAKRLAQYAGFAGGDMPTAELAHRPRRNLGRRV